MDSIRKYINSGSRSNGWPDHVKNVLCSWEILNTRHCVQLEPISHIAKSLSITHASVKKILAMHGIESPSVTTLRKSAVMRKYGVENVGSITEVIDKRNATMTEMYGGHNFSHASGKRTNRNVALIAKYGTIHPSKTQPVKDKAKLTNQLRYERHHPNQQHISNESWQTLNCLQEMQDLTNHFPILTISSMLGVSEAAVYTAFCNHGISPVKHGYSDQEIQLRNFIQSIYDKEVIFNDRLLIDPFEIDIIIPDLRIAIEYCGLFWHSEVTKHPKYHKQKLDKCRSHQYRLITIFEDEWMNNRTIVENKISSILNCNLSPKVFARKCEIRTISTTIKQAFLDQYHIQGNGPGSISYSLQYNNSIVAVMSFISKPNGKFVLNRYATSCTVPGGFTKLLKHFQINNEWATIETFADLRWSNGEMYDKSGFVLEYTIPPDYYWVYSNRRYHKFNFRHSQLKTKFLNYDPKLTEVENCHNNNYYRIYDCGKLKYSLTSLIKWL